MKPSHIAGSPLERQVLSESGTQPSRPAWSDKSGLCQSRGRQRPLFAPSPHFKRGLSRRLQASRDGPEGWARCGGGTSPVEGSGVPRKDRCVAGCACGVENACGVPVGHGRIRREDPSPRLGLPARARETPPNATGQKDAVGLRIERCPLDDAEAVPRRPSLRLANRPARAREARTHRSGAFARARPRDCLVTGGPDSAAAARRQGCADLDPQRRSSGPTLNYP
jgi:hypothetical protein